MYRECAHDVHSFISLFSFISFSFISLFPKLCNVRESGSSFLEFHFKRHFFLAFFFRYFSSTSTLSSLFINVEHVDDTKYDPFHIAVIFVFFFLVLEVPQRLKNLTQK